MVTYHETYDNIALSNDYFFIRNVSGKRTTANHHPVVLMTTTRCWRLVIEIY